MIYSFCPNCFSPTHTALCGLCGYNQEEAKVFPNTIHPSHILNARYLIGRVLGKGGFGVTYLAKDLLYNRLVAIKECLPESYAHRTDGYTIVHNQNDTSAFNHCKQNFRDEISTLVKLKDNSFVVDVYDYFSENNTEYFVMEYIKGKSLKYLTYIQNGKTSLENAAIMFFTVGSALMEVHQHGIIHRDISPENIMFDSDGGISLIDFGACKNFTLPPNLGSESIFLKPGFAPPEQYEFDGNQGEWTDVYALAATFYTVVSGEPLVDSTHRLENDTMKSLLELDCDVPVSVSRAVQKAMSPEIEYRYKTIGEFMDDMTELAQYANKIDAETAALIKTKTTAQFLPNVIGPQAQSYKDLKFPYVEIVSGKHKGEKIKIPDFGFVSLGRAAETANMVIDDFDQISRVHCIVGYDRSKNRFIVIDKSHNGTFFNNYNRMLCNSQSFLKPDETFFVYSPELKIKVTLY